MWPFKKKHRITPDYIYKLKKNQVFVFGSNAEGHHEGGAARQAMCWGARWGEAVGRQGNTYAIATLSTKGLNGRGKLKMNTIKRQVYNFIHYASLRPGTKFFVTEIGCGIAGYTPKEIGPLFKEALQLKNVWLPESFLEVLDKQGIAKE